MKKIISLSTLLLLFFSFVSGQSVNVTGTVKNLQGNPIHFAFIRNKQTKAGTYTDKAGNFTLVAYANSLLLVSCAGFRDTTINILNNTAITVTLNGKDVKGAVNDETTGASNLNQATLRDQINLSNAPLVNSTGVPANVTPISPKTGTPIYNEPTLGTTRTDALQGAIFPVFSTKEETRGSRYLFSEWAHGFVVNSKDSIIQRSNFLFNYDKIGGGLLLSQDRKSAIEVNKDLVKSFTLYGPENQQYKFEYVPLIDKGHYVQVLDEGNKYKIYKKITVEFVKSDYATNGITTTGNPYDEYVDKGTYYVIANNGAPQQIALKKKSLKEAFSADADKLNKYFKENSGDIDDNYLIDVGVYMNR